jgi:hypothetical protein
LELEDNEDEIKPTAMVTKWNWERQTRYRIWKT